MPNWCNNTLFVTGPREAVAAFVAKAEYTDSAGETQALSFESHVPMPPSVKESTESPSPMPEWYTWCVAHWGTKWDVSADSVSRRVVNDSPALVTYDFDTAWSPPLPWLKRASAQHPELQFTLRFVEEGNGFAGEVQVQAGEVLNEEEFEPREALVRWHGHYTAYCELCEADYEETDPAPDSRLCEECRYHRCLHCKKLDREHAPDGKCLFASTQFEAREALPPPEASGPSSSSGA